MTAKKQVLLVDDDQDILDQLSLALRAEGYEVVTAQGRQEGEELLMLRQPDLAVIDLMMEEMDSGFVLCHEIKKLYPDTPVIMLTAVTAATGLDFHARSKEARAWVKADALLDKPVRFEQLREEVRRLLRSPATEATASGV
jgi:two-component system, OmpR family, response regulator